MHFNDDDTPLLGNALEREAQLYLAQRSAEARLAPTTIMVADLEYAWDLPAFEAYLVAEGRDARKKPLWPFHHVVAASWLTMRFEPGEPVPEITGPVVMAADGASEQDMVEALFADLMAEPRAVLTTWGGEAKDLAVLRRCSATLDLLLPPQLCNGSPHCPMRLDLCRATAVQADAAHLPELAAAVSIPAKPSPSRSIGALVEAGRWPEVREQVLADVLTTSVFAVRHLQSHGRITCEVPATVAAIGEAAAGAVPASAFTQRTFLPWAKAAAIRAKLRQSVLIPV